MAKKEKMRGLLKPVNKTLMFPIDFVLTNDTVIAYRIDDETLGMTIAPDPVDLTFDCAGFQSVVLYGAPGKGKTSLAESLASLQPFTTDNGIS